jgi:hypothetical protein
MNRLGTTRGVPMLLEIAQPSRLFSSARRSRADGFDLNPECAPTDPVRSAVRTAACRHADLENRVRTPVPEFLTRFHREDGSSPGDPDRTHLLVGRSAHRLCDPLCRLFRKDPTN